MKYFGGKEETNKRSIAICVVMFGTWKKSVGLLKGGVPFKLVLTLTSTILLSVPNEILNYSDSAAFVMF